MRAAPPVTRSAPTARRPWLPDQGNCRQGGLLLPPGVHRCGARGRGAARPRLRRPEPGRGDREQSGWRDRVGRGRARAGPGRAVRSVAVPGRHPPRHPDHRHHPYLEITRYLSAHRDEVEPVFDVLSYFDGVGFASRAKAPAWFSTGLMDDICPPSTAFGAHHAYAGPKQIAVWDYNGHEAGGSADLDIVLSAFRALLVRNEES